LICHQALADEAVAPAKVPYDTYSGYFVSNKFEPESKCSFVVLADQEQFDKVFGAAFVMRDKSHRLPKDAFKTLVVIATIKRGNAFWEYEVENVTVERGVLQLRYKTTFRKTPEAIFACPLIVSVPKDNYQSVVFIENEKRLKTVVTAHQAVLPEDESQILFDFSKLDATKQWQTVNDGVMGGVSEGRFQITDNKTMEFFGTLSLKNNGGFASVRSKPTEVKLKAGDSVAARVRGDGREYRLNLYVRRDSGRYSFRQSFKTKKDEWIEVSLPVNKFVATWHGRVFPDQKLDPGKVNSVGFLLADKKAGPFKLEVDWIKVIEAE
jgi:monofunctional biosynthetic peptidoglycan transglycosylase